MDDDDDEQQPDRQPEHRAAGASRPPVRRTIDPSEPWSEERMRGAAPAEMLRDLPADERAARPDDQIDDSPH